MVGVDGLTTIGFSASKLPCTLGLPGMQSTPPCWQLLSLVSVHPIYTGQSCTICHGFDHTQAFCALKFVQQPLWQDSSTRLTLEGRPSQKVCLSWNGGQCAFPSASCLRRHLCATCGSTQHRARDCRDTPADSCFKRWSVRQSRPLATSSTPASYR